MYPSNTKVFGKAPTLTLDFLTDFESCILAIGEQARAQTAPFPNTFAVGE